MDLLQMRLFLSLARTLNFTKTAGEFFMSQPAVSHQIRAMEKSLGVALLERDSRHVRLTPHGQEYVTYASRILALQAAAENRIRNLAAGRKGHIKVAVLSSSMGQFSKHLEQFCAENPLVQVDIDVLEGGQMSKAISLCDRDVYFANENMLPVQSSVLDYVVTGSSRLHLFVHCDNELGIDMDDWNTLNGQGFIFVTESDFTLASQIRRICSNRGIAPEIIGYYNRADMVLTSVNAGVGAAVLPPELYDVARFPNVVSLPIEGEDASVSSVVAWHKDGANPDAQAFLDVVLPERRKTTNL